MQKLAPITRRGFLYAGAAAGGGLFVALAWPNAVRADDIFKPNDFIEIADDGAITLTIGKSEMGQGTLTGIAQLLADELECAWQDIRIVQAPSAPVFGFPHNGFMVTGGSTGLRSEWVRMRTMGAAARMMLAQAAANLWATDVAKLQIADSVVTAPDGRRAGFGELAAKAAKLSVPDRPALKDSGSRTFIGKSMARMDTEKKVTGEALYGIDVEFAGMLTAVIIAPPRLGAPVISFDATRALARSGVSNVVSISSGVAIVGEHYWAVHSARDDVDVEWGESPLAGLNMTDLRADYRQALARLGKVAEATGDVNEGRGRRAVVREFEQPYLAHACMEPMNITVSIEANRAVVWGPTQAQTFVQNAVAKVAGIDPKNVTVHTTFLGGGFGRRSATDFATAAAEIAKAAGKIVKLVYSREDDMQAGYYRPSSMTRAAATLDDAGRIASLDVKIAVPSVSKWSGAHFLIDKQGLDKHAVEGLRQLAYDIPNTRVEWVDHDPKVPVQFWRSVGGSHNPFVIESLIDDLATVAGKDPYAFRRSLLRGHPRHLAVLDRLAKEADWGEPPAAGIGRGIALAKSFDSIVGEVAEVRIDGETLRVERVYCVVDCGIAVNPALIEAQMQSAIVYGLSAFLRGQITLDNGAVEQSNFHDYEPLRMPEMPEIKVVVLEGGDRPGGVGEPGLPPILPAVANALRALNGTRLTRLPMQA